MLSRKATLQARINAAIREDDGCLRWPRKPNTYGYGYFDYDRRRQYAHRAVYELLVGPIPDGYQLDHLCHDPDKCNLGNLCPHRMCIEVEHLEAVTPVENNIRSGSLSSRNARKTHCLRGHEFTEGNTYWTTNQGRPARQCRACMVVRDRLAGIEERIPPRCGTHSSYVTGCRCGECREANRSYQRAWRKRRRSHVGS